MKLYRRRVPSPTEPTAVQAPQLKVNNLPVGATYGNRVCLGWQFDADRYAIQTRSYKMVKHLRRIKGAVLLADALEGPYMQTWLLPVRKDSQGRQLVDYLLETFGSECDQSRKVQTYREGVADLPQNVSVENLDYFPAVSPQRTARKPAEKRGIPEQDWSWVEDRLDAVGVEFCIAFPRSDAEWAVQATDPRLHRHFGKRGITRMAGHSVAGWGTLRLFIFPCESKSHARKVVLQALKTLPEYEANKHKLEGAGK